MKKTTTLLGLAAVAVLCAAANLTSQEAEEASAPSPDAIARMAPGPMHAKLEPLIGSWKMAGRWRMAPDAPWNDFEATVERRWILEGRFVEETMESEFMGEKMEGIGILGYDNTREQFTMVWFESISTGTFVTTGQLEDGKIVFEGENADCMTGNPNRWSRSVLDLTSDGHPYTGYFKDDSGKEYLSMEMTSSQL